MITQERLKYLIEVCNSQQASPVELEELDHWYASFEQDQDLTSSLNANEKAALEQKLLGKINTRLDMPVYQLKWRYFAVAAAVLILISAGIGFYRSYTTSNEVPVYAKHKNDIAPGKNKAMLTLADGSVIDLNEQANGILASQQHIKIVKTADGTLKYEGGASANKSDEKNIAGAGLNTISIPRGGQYQIILPDGSKVWLNSASSLKYPAVFADSKREVELSGEAYFEIAHDKTKPFTVRSAGQLLKVLGTRFNINSYPDKSPAKTTLLEGSIALSENADGPVRKMSPGQQAVLTPSGFQIAAVDTEESVAWKNGYFLFKNTDLKTLLAQLERWYDVDIIYDAHAEKRFYGKISRDVKLSSVLNMLEVTSNIKFRIEGRSVILKN